MSKPDKHDIIPKNVVGGATFFAAILIIFAYLMVRLGVRNKQKNDDANRRRE